MSECKGGRERRGKEFSLTYSCVLYTEQQLYSFTIQKAINFAVAVSIVACSTVAVLGVIIALTLILDDDVLVVGVAELVVVVIADAYSVIFFEISLVIFFCVFVAVRIVVVIAAAIVVVVSGIFLNFQVHVTTRRGEFDSV